MGDKDCEKRRKMLKFTTFIIELLLLILAFELVAKRNKKLFSKQGVGEIVAAFFCTPCYIAFALMSKPPKA